MVQSCIYHSCFIRESLRVSNFNSVTKYSSRFTILLSLTRLPPSILSKSLQFHVFLRLIDESYISHILSSVSPFSEINLRSCYRTNNHSFINKRPTNRTECAHLLISLCQSIDQLRITLLLLERSPCCQLLGPRRLTITPDHCVTAIARSRVTSSLPAPD